MFFWRSVQGICEQTYRYSFKAFSHRVPRDQPLSASVSSTEWWKRHWKVWLVLTHFKFVAIKRFVSVAVVYNFSTSIWVAHEIILNKTLMMICSYLMVSLCFEATQQAILSVFFLEIRWVWFPSFYVQPLSFASLTRSCVKPWVSNKIS